MTGSCCLLAVDATSQRLSVAVVSKGKVTAVSREAARPHDEILLPVVERLLRRAGVAPAQLQAVAAASGPGRFTGIRIGMAYAAVASRALGVPALAVSRLEALAWAAAPGTVCAAIPGWKGERYYQIFRVGRAGRAPRAAGAPVWVSAESWEAQKKRLGDIVLVEREATAEDLLAPAAEQLRLRAKPDFAPLYLKPAGYEALR